MSAPKRKRSADEVNDESQSKKRGRPRLEKQDESAIDRRRTQIRVAQRAYRQRQEGALDDLRDRVSELTGTVQKMYDEFNRCFVHAMSSHGLHSAHQSVLQNAAKQFELLIGTIRETSQELPITPPPETNERLTTKVSGGDRYEPRPANVSSWMDQLELNQEASRTEKAQAGAGYTLIESEEIIRSGFPDESVVLDDDILQDQNRLSIVKSASPYELYTFLPGFQPLKLKPQTTYSFQETTIARRLHRACLEAGYHLLLEPEHRPEVYERVFGFALASRHRDELTTMMKSILARDTTEPLEILEAPIALLGGAGTHYPRHERFGLPDPSMLSQNLAQISNYTYAMLARDAHTSQVTSDLRGFEGEWLDPYDVQGYLEEKGIFIDPATSFAEIEIPSEPPSPGYTTASSAPSLHSYDVSDMQMSEPATLFVNSPAMKRARGEYAAYDSQIPNSTGGFTNALTGLWMHDQSTDQTLLDNLIPFEDLQQQSPNSALSADKVQNWSLETRFESLLPTPSPSRQSQKRTVLIDVTKFVQTLVTSAVCLGRTPGYRRHDVDRALLLSQFDAY